MSSLTFFVPGVPAPGGSKTGFYSKKLNRVLMAPASKKTKPWMATVAGVVRSEYDGEPLLGPLQVRFSFQLLRPKGHYGTGKKAGIVKDSFRNTYPTVTPDLTKLIRSAEDALKGILWKDDCQIVLTTALKMYVEKDSGVIIEVAIK